jgi:hypothetical protein
LGKKTGVYRKNHMTLISAHCGQNAEFLNAGAELGAKSGFKMLKKKKKKKKRKNLDLAFIFP